MSRTRVMAQASDALNVKVLRKTFFTDHIDYDFSTWVLFAGVKHSISRDRKKETLEKARNGQEQLTSKCTQTYNPDRSWSTRKSRERITVRRHTDILYPDVAFTNMVKANGMDDPFGNDTMFGECLKLPFYCGPVEGWILTTNGFFIAINILSALITLVANSVFLVVYSKTLSLRTPHNFFLMLLAITDISVGLISQPLFIARKFMEINSIHDCVLWTAMRATVYYFSGISFLTLTLVSFERYLAVCQPLKHRCDVTPRRMAVVAFVVWAVWLAFPVIRFALSDYYRAFGMLIGGIILVMFVINGCLYRKIQRAVSGKQLVKNDLEMRKVTRDMDIKREARMAKTVVFLLVVMVLAFLPTALGLAYKATKGINTIYLFVFLPLADSLVLLNSSFNPLFYCYRNKNIRLAIRTCISPRRMTRASSTTLESIKVSG